VTSGTATLEAALFNVPQVVCYSTSPLTYHLAKWFIRVRFISLVNLIMEREVVKELIQGDLNQERLQKELTDILPEGSRHAPVLNDYDELRSVMGGSGASVRVAKDMADNLNSKK
jgi:lipid-A-disaccharide synthase